MLQMIKLNRNISEITITNKLLKKTYSHRRKHKVESIYNFVNVKHPFYSHKRDYFKHMIDSKLNNVFCVLTDGQKPSLSWVLYSKWSRCKVDVGVKISEFTPFWQSREKGQNTLSRHLIPCPLAQCFFVIYFLYINRVKNNKLNDISL